MASSLEHIARPDLPAEFGQAWDVLNDLTGEPAFVEVFATAPHVLKFVMGDFYQRLFFEGEVSQRYKQLARLRLSALHGCQTCNKQNQPGAAQAGFSAAQITAVMADHTQGDFDDAERAVLRFADQVALTNAAGHLDDTLTKELQQHFTSGQICELGTVMAVISGMAKLAFVMDLVEKEDYCEFA